MSVKIDKPKKIISKKDKYVNERQNVLNRLYIILGITDTNKIFYLDDIDANRGKVNQIIELVPDVKLYFRCSSWSIFATPERVEKKWLSLTKAIIKDMGYKTTSFTEIIVKGRRHGVKII